MQSKEVRAFKNELRNYAYWKSRLVTLSNSIEYCYERLGGVRGIDPSKEPTHAMPNKELEYKLRDDIERYRHDLERFTRRIEEVDIVLARIDKDLAEAIRNVYIERQQMRKVADKFYLSYNGLSYRMDKAIQEALDEEN